MLAVVPDGTDVSVTAYQKCDLWKPAMLQWMVAGLDGLIELDGVLPFVLQWISVCWVVPRIATISIKIPCRLLLNAVVVASPWTSAYLIAPRIRAQIKVAPLIPRASIGIV
jgi:hypothetical protein